jgi:hypothetical protein
VPPAAGVGLYGSDAGKAVKGFGCFANAFSSKEVQRGHMGKQSHAPKQLLGVVTLHAVCEE